MKRLEVRLRRHPGEESVVGQLAVADRRIHFVFDEAFLKTGLDLSPYRFPPRPDLVEHRDLGFGPLPGLFDDSMPDGWGRLLMDRHARREGLVLRTALRDRRCAGVGRWSTSLPVAADRARKCREPATVRGRPADGTP